MGGDQISEIKSKVNIVDVIGERITLTKAGKNLKAPCPFHSERTPSFIVSPDIQFYKCFGCGEHGDVFTFLEKYEGMDFFEALKYLAQKVGVKLQLHSAGQKGIKESIYEINNLAAKFYNYILLKHPGGKDALKYLLEERGLKLSTIEEFGLGFCPDRQFALKEYLIKKKTHPGLAEKAGIVFKSGNYIVDRFRGRIIFPLFDHRGNICGFAGRLMPGSVSERAKYINTPETAVYTKSKLLYGLNLVKAEIKKRDYAVIVEGELDMISSWQYGVRNTLAIKGSALTADQIKLLSRYTKKIILALDSDFAGNTAARRGIEVADKEGMEIKVAKLAPYKDPDEATRKDPEFYKESLRNSVPVWDFIIDSVFSKHSKLGGIEKGRISKELAPVLQGISDKIVQAHYAEVVAKKIGVSVDAVFEQIKGRKPEGLVPEAKLQNKVSRLDLLEKNLVSVLLAYNPPLLTEKKFEKHIVKPLHKKIISEIKKFLRTNNRFDLSDFANVLPDELKEGFNNLVIDGSVNENLKDYEKEIEIVVYNIRKIKLLKKREKLTGLMATEHNSDSLRLLNEKFNKLSKKLSELEEISHKGIILKNQ